jgi:ParB-like chromosome segregation protein Spo0J
MRSAFELNFSTEKSKGLISPASELLAIEDISEDLPHEKIDGLEPMGEKDFKHLKDHIKKNGIMTPLIVKELADSYRLIEGHHRLRAAKELGMSEVPVQYLQKNLSGKAERELAVKANLLRRQISREDKVKLLRQYYSEDLLDHKMGRPRKDDKTKSTSQIAAETGFSDKFIQRQKKKLSDEIRKLNNEPESGHLSTFRSAEQQEAQLYKSIQTIISGAIEESKALKPKKQKDFKKWLLAQAEKL